MTKTEPWRQLPPAVAEVVEPELPAVTAEIMETIAREVPEYARPFEGSFGRGVRTGVSEALRQFVALVQDPGFEREREVYVALGRGELNQGRTLDSLQAAYRVGARVAWRRIATAGRRQGLDAETLSLLAEAMFAYIDELSADSVEGYAQAQSERAGERQRRRRELAALLLRDPPAEQAEVRATAQAAGWRVPRRMAALACAEEDLARVARDLPPEALTAVVEGTGCAIVPAPAPHPGPWGSDPWRSDPSANRAPRGQTPVRAAVGPAGPREDLPASWRLAREALAAGVAVADDDLVALVRHRSAELVQRIAQRRLAPLRDLTPKARARMEETALAFVRGQGNAAAMAREMHVHPQTARYRLARLRELLGDALDDPRARFEIELALGA
jgi:PucR-like helix-turn-helix protein